MAFFEKIVKAVFPTPEKRPDFCPHGHEGVKPISCAFCQLDEKIPYFKKRLTEQEKTEFFEKIQQLREMFTVEKLRRAIEEGDEEYENKAKELYGYMRILMDGKVGAEFLPGFVWLPGKILGHGEEQINWQLESFVRRLTTELDDTEKEAQEDLAEGQATLEPYLEWKKKAEEFKKAKGEGR